MGMGPVELPDSQHMHAMATATGGWVKAGKLPDQLAVEGMLAALSQRPVLPQLRLLQQAGPERGVEAPAGSSGSVIGLAGRTGQAGPPADTETTSGSVQPVTPHDAAAIMHQS